MDSGDTRGHLAPLLVPVSRVAVRLVAYTPSTALLGKEAKEGSVSSKFAQTHPHRPYMGLLFTL